MGLWGLCGLISQTCNLISEARKAISGEILGVIGGSLKAVVVDENTLIPRGQEWSTDTVCYKRLLYMVGFLRPPATTSGWTTFPTGCCYSAIQDGVQDGRHLSIIPAISVCLSVCLSDCDRCFSTTIGPMSLKLSRYIAGALWMCLFKV